MRATDSLRVSSIRGLAVRPEPGESLPGPLVVGSKDNNDSSPPDSGSYVQYSESFGIGLGGLPTSSALYTSTAGTLVLHSCPVEVGDKAVGELDVVYEDFGDTSSTTGWFDIVVLESDGSLPCGGPAEDVCQSP